MNLLTMRRQLLYQRVTDSLPHGCGVSPDACYICRPAKLFVTWLYVRAFEDLAEESERVKNSERAVRAAYLRHE